MVRPQRSRPDSAGSRGGRSSVCLVVGDLIQRVPKRRLDIVPAANQFCLEESVFVAALVQRRQLLHAREKWQYGQGGRGILIETNRSGIERRIQFVREAHHGRVERGGIFVQRAIEARRGVFERGGELGGRAQ